MSKFWSPVPAAATPRIYHTVYRNVDPWPLICCVHVPRSEVEVDELRGTALTDGDGRYPEKQQDWPQHFRTQVAHHRADAAVIIETRPQGEHRDQADHEQIAPRERCRARPA